MCIIYLLLAPVAFYNCYYITVWKINDFTILCVTVPANVIANIDYKLL